ncbi:MAG: putative lipid II flippase FtsW [Micavibrio aeruginosavorus]|uniref:Probable peptidoglycan glycosyltransferase FtsW n=1 Tax=Micavibrio aeruginosavorus TaxID=349221 RepID=A0A2W5FKH9_9BACT|nr:MAG: putative lipid II flippase FtsW [Micavibrio aeruginosavorus]
MKPNLFARTDRSAIASWWWTVDRGLLACIIVLAVFGVALVTTASPPVAIRIGADHAHFIIRHIMVVIPALVMMLCISVMSHKTIRRLGTVVLGLMMFLMVVVLLGGNEIKGAQRWISLPGFSLQPSELVKPAFAIVAGWLIAHQKSDPRFRGYIYSAVLYFVIVVLLILQPDFGMTVVLTCMFAAQIFLAGFPFRYLTIFAGIGVGGIFAAYFGLHHVRSRIDRFMNPESGDTYQVDKSLEAFANGGFFGQGPGQGVVKNTIPDAHADFIFSVAGEELGLLFTLVIVALYAYILLRGFNRLMESNDMFVVLAVGGILSMFGLQALVHMGSALHLLPTKGMTLPFISYGGSSTLAMGLSMGVVLGLTRRQARSSIAKGGFSHSIRKGTV